MNCIECKATNPDTSRYCGHCGAELGRTLDETIRKKGFRDRQATEMEITTSVVGRLMTWLTWLGSIATVIVALFGLLIGWSYRDVRTAVASGKTQIDAAVREGVNIINAEKQTAEKLNDQLEQLKSNVDQYSQVNKSIEKLQKEIIAVQGQIVDLGEKGLRANSLETTGPGPASIGFNKMGCPTSDPKRSAVVYCVQGSPLSLYQLTSGGELRPVSSRSPVGFQDVSNAAKPTCTSFIRGTFYLEKGAGKAPDEPFVCAKESNDTYDWIQLGITP
jgi:gas vesicle protein